MGNSENLPRKVLSYDPTTRQITFASIVVSTVTPTYYFFRKDATPMDPTGSNGINYAYPTTTTVGVSTVSVPGLNGKTGYIGQQLQIGAMGLVRTITNIVGDVVTFEPAIGAVIGAIGVFVRVFNKDDIVIEGLGQNVTGKYIQINSDTYVTSSTELQSIPTKILSYSGDIITAPIPRAASNSDGYVILMQFKDNYSPLNWVGSTMGMQNPRCYTLDLCEFIIPGAQNISEFPGGTIGNYPYIYMEFIVEDQPATGVLVSNNPASTRALFKIPTANDYLTSFLRLSCCTSPCVKFKPNDSFHIRLLSPSGSVIQWLTPDTLSPYYPNPALQISITIRASPCGETLI